MSISIICHLYIFGTLIIFVRNSLISSGGTQSFLFAILIAILIAVSWFWLFMGLCFFFLSLSQPSLEGPYVA